jgi:hypothetical protein
MFLFFTAALMATLGAACGEIDDLEQKSPVRGGDYYWSGGKKIGLDIDRSLIIVGFDSEEYAGTFVETMPEEASLFRETIVWVNIINEEVRQRVLDDKTASNKIYGHRYSGSDSPFRMTGEIIMKPKEGVSSQDIVQRCKVDANSVEETDIGVIIMLNDWSELLVTANTIYESGMVDWCHPDFWMPLEHY